MESQAPLGAAGCLHSVSQPITQGWAGKWFEWEPRLVLSGLARLALAKPLPDPGQRKMGASRAASLPGPSLKAPGRRGREKAVRLACRKRTGRGDVADPLPTPPGRPEPGLNAVSGSPGNPARRPGCPASPPRGASRAGAEAEPSFCLPDFQDSQKLSSRRGIRGAETTTPEQAVGSLGF